MKIGFLNFYLQLNILDVIKAIFQFSISFIYPIFKLTKFTEFIIDWLHSVFSYHNKIFSESFIYEVVINIFFFYAN